MPSQVRADLDVQRIEFQRPLAFAQRLAEAAHRNKIVRKPVMCIRIVSVERNRAAELRPDSGRGSNFTASVSGRSRSDPGALVHSIGPNASGDDSNCRNGKCSPVPGELCKSAEERNVYGDGASDHFASHFLPGNFYRGIS
jgi:hypothetical protein